MRQQQLNFTQEVAYAVKMARKKSAIARLYVMLFTETLYGIWSQRNDKFANELVSPVQLVKENLCSNL